MPFLGGLKGVESIISHTNASNPCPVVDKISGLSKMKRWCHCSFPCGAIGSSFHEDSGSGYGKDLCPVFGFGMLPGLVDSGGLGYRYPRSIGGSPPRQRACASDPAAAGPAIERDSRRLGRHGCSALPEATTTASGRTRARKHAAHGGLCVCGVRGLEYPPPAALGGRVG